MVKKASKTRKLVLWLAPLVLVVAGGYAISVSLKRSEQAKLRKVYETREVVVKKRDVKKVLQLSGKILPSSSIDVFSPVSGQIVDILVKEGDRVKADSSLFAVKQDSTGEKELEARRNDVEKARLDLQAAEENLVRMKSVVELFSAAEHEKAEMDVSRSRVALEASQDGLRLLEESLGLQGKSAELKKGKLKSRLSTIFVKAPRSSVVTLISKSIGDAVIGTTSGSQVADTAVLTLSDVGKMIARAKVLESDLEQLSPGMDVDIRLDALSEKAYKGKISRISQQGIDDKAGGFTYFLADVAIENANEKVRSQMNASLRIPVGEKKDVLSVPIDAVATSGQYSVVELPPDENESLSAERKPKYLDVKVGMMGDEYVEILSNGLTENQKILKIDFSKIDPKKLASGKINEADNLGGKKGNGRNPVGGMGRPH